MRVGLSQSGVGVNRRARIQVGSKRKSSSPVEIGSLVAARALRDGWTVELDFYGMSPDTIDPTKLTSVALTYPATDLLGVSNIAPPAINGVASHICKWWDGDNLFPDPYVSGSVLRVAVRVNAPIRGDDTGTVTVGAGLIPGSQAGSVSLDCSASMLIHLATVEANPDPLGWLTARVEHPYGCRKAYADLIVFDPATATPNAQNNLPNGWTYFVSGGKGIIRSTQDDAVIAGYDTGGVAIDFRHKRCVARDNYVHLDIAYTMAVTLGVVSFDAAGNNNVDSCKALWNDVDGGWGPNVSCTVVTRGIYERVGGINVFNNEASFNHIWGTNDDSGRISGGGSKASNNYSETGGWASASINPATAPHYDGWEFTMTASGSTDMPVCSYNFTSFEIGDKTGINVQWGRTSYNSWYGTGMSGPTASNGPTKGRSYRNIAGFGARQLSFANDTQYYIAHAAESGSINSMITNYGIQIVENFFDEPGLAYHYPNAAGYYGIEEWSNNRRLRSSTIGGTFAPGSIIDDDTLTRIRSPDATYLVSRIGDAFIADGTVGSNVLTNVNTDLTSKTYLIGATITGPSVPANTTVVSMTSTTVTISKNITGTNPVIGGSYTIEPDKLSWK